MNITDISGVGDATAKLLKTHGIDSVEAVARAAIEQLAAVPGIGASRAAALGESARRLLPDATAGAAESPEAVPATSGDAEEGSETVAALTDDGAKSKRTKGGKGKKGKKGKKEKKEKKRDKESQAEKKSKGKKKDKARNKKKNKRK